MKIVVLDGQTLNPGDNPWKPVQDALSDTDEFVVYAKTEPEQIIERSLGATILLTNKTPLNSNHLSQLPELKLICVLATGVNTVDIEAAKLGGITVCNVPEYGTDSVAQFVFSQVLHFAHRVALHDERIRDGVWLQKNEFCFWETPQIELAGLTIGIVGYGRIGKAVGKLADAFGMNVIAYSPSGVSGDGIAHETSLENIYSRSDIISLHCVLNDQTRELIDFEALSKMKPSCFLINTARGGLINEDAICQALNEGRIAGAALDVVSEEPLPLSSPLYQAPNLLLTPHMAWGSVQARKRLMRTTADNIKAFLEGRQSNTVA